MTVRETPSTEGIGGIEVARAAAGAPRALASPRRLPAPKDWPLGAILAAQIGILIAAIALWELAADTGVLDAFFW